MRKRLLLALAVVLAAGTARTQTTLTGFVYEAADDGTETPIVGANVYWLGTTSGSTTNPDGGFTLPVHAAGARLVVSAVGYLADTLALAGAGAIRVALMPAARQVAEVEVVGERSPTVLDYLSPAGVRVMTEKELFKAACCNLSESFETNPSIDVAFTDAVTGTRQIEMLGLAGTYSQITLENLPAVRGLTSNVGLTYIPGTWIDNIQVSKGVGSVANGYESITGQINVELRKPSAENESRLFVNMYGNNDLRLETNLHYREQLGEDWSSMTLLHLGTQQRAMDGNGDRFLDLPLSTTVNAFQRFMFSGHGGLEGQFGIQYVEDEKKGGTLRGVTMERRDLAGTPSEYGFRTRSRQWRLAGKTGQVFSPEERRSIGLQYVYTEYRQDAFFGPRDYEGRERTVYLNLLFQTDLGSSDHSIRAGIGFLYDAFDETLAGVSHARTERVPGAFVEYTAVSDEVFSLVAGLRADRHNLFGSFLTPRLHVRYALSEDWVVRALAGRGQRSANVIAENIGYLAGGRSFDLPPSDAGYPFEPEVAWNVGFNVTRYFAWGAREGTIVADFYRTVFDKQVVVNLDGSPQQALFENLAGRSFSNSVQVEVNFQPVERLDTRFAYRFLDVRQSGDRGLRERPFVARHRMLLNFGYSTEREGPDDTQMVYDLTIQWFGRKRLPDTDSNPAELRLRAGTPDFALLNAQVTRAFSIGFDLYLGAENLLGFRQADPILDAGNPNSFFFDGSYVWGPVAGRMIYAGMRLRM